MATITAAETFPITTGGSPDFETSNAYSGTFIPAYWSGKLNVKFYETSTFFDIANTNWEGEIKSKGDKVVIREAPSITISDYEIGNLVGPEVPEPSTFELNIDQAKSYNFAVHDVLAHQSDINLMDQFSTHAAEQMKIEMDRDNWLATFDGASAANKGSSAGLISSAYNLGTDASPVTLGSVTDPDATPATVGVLEFILKMASVLDEQNVPESDRWLVITPRERLLLMQSPLAQAYYTGDPSSPVRNGKLGMIDRFQLYVSNLLPRANAAEDWEGSSNAGTATRHAIVAGHKSAITFASQFTKTETIRNPNDFGDAVRGLNVFGRTISKSSAMALGVVAG